MPEYKPIYMKMRYEAARNGEKALWLESFKEDRRCAQAIEKAIREKYHDNKLEDGTAEVLAEFGPKRVSWVLANTVAELESDGRFSLENRQWASNICMPLNDRCGRGFVSAHPGLVNLFIDQVRRAGQLVLSDALNAEDRSWPIKVSFFCPLVGNIVDSEGNESPVDGRYLQLYYKDDIEEELENDQEGDDEDMAEYFDTDDGIKAKLVSIRWGVESSQGQLLGKIDCFLREPLTDPEVEIVKDWILGQNADGYGEHFEQTGINTDEGSLYVSFWSGCDDYSIMTQDELDERLESPGMTIGGM